MVKRVYSYSEKTSILSCECTYGTYRIVLTFNFVLQSLTCQRITTSPIQWYRNEVSIFMNYVQSFDVKYWKLNYDVFGDLFDERCAQI